MVSKGVGVEVMFTYKINVDVKEWDLFLENHPQGNLLQSSDWSKIKDTWGNERVGFYKEDQLVGVANILIKPKNSSSKKQRTGLKKIAHRFY